MQSAKQILENIVSSIPTKPKNKPIEIGDFGEHSNNNTIFNQQNRICLNKVDLEKVQIALSEIDEAKKHLMGAIAALAGFDGISKRDLLIAANMAHGYDHMLQEFLHQSRGGLKYENLNYGLVSVGGAR